nr:MAG TPA: hypothetical protein [Bacteriophage sp.]
MTRFSRRLTARGRARVSSRPGTTREASTTASWMMFAGSASGSRS